MRVPPELLPAAGGPPHAVPAGPFHVVHLEGPAVCPIDTLGASFDTDGGLLVDTGAARAGAADNPLRTVQP